MDEKNRLRSQILKLAEQYFQEYHNQEHFKPGYDYINYSGRVYDSAEGVSLISSALDFWLTSGEYSKKLESRIEKYLNVKHSLLTNSGSSANLLAVSALTSDKLGSKRLKQGDEVITVAAGFPTTVNPIYQNNLVPVYCDVDVSTLNIETSQLELALSPKSKAIFIAHTLGNPFDIDSIMEFANKNDLWVIEDNCDALGSTWRGQRTGSFGHISTQSFYPPHHITLGEGGAVNTNNTKLKKIIESFRDWGRDCWCESGCDDTCGKRFGWSLGDLPKGYDHKYIYSHIGYNLKVTDLQAAVGLAQMDKLDGFVDKRKTNHKFFLDEFKKYEDFFVLPVQHELSDPSWFGFFLTIKEGAPFKRIDLVNYLESNKIATRMLFAGNITKQPAYIGKQHRIIGELQNTNRIMENSFWIGVYPGITDEKAKYIVDVFDKYFEKY
jgi:CDP-4-dehydro-6-deoxyglucose reductase, E1